MKKSIAMVMFAIIVMIQAVTLSTFDAEWWRTEATRKATYALVQAINAGDVDQAQNALQNKPITVLGLFTPTVQFESWVPYNLLTAAVEKGNLEIIKLIAAYNVFSRQSSNLSMYISDSVRCSDHFEQFKVLVSLDLTDLCSYPGSCAINPIFNDGFDPVRPYKDSAIYNILNNPKCSRPEVINFLIDYLTNKGVSAITHEEKNRKVFVELEKSFPHIREKYSEGQLQKFREQLALYKLKDQRLKTE